MALIWMQLIAAGLVLISASWLWERRTYITEDMQLLEVLTRAEIASIALKSVLLMFLILMVMMSVNQTKGLVNQSTLQAVLTVIGWFVSLGLGIHVAAWYRELGKDLRLIQPGESKVLAVVHREMPCLVPLMVFFVLFLQGS